MSLHETLNLSGPHFSSTLEEVSKLGFMMQMLMEGVEGEVSPANPGTGSSSLQGCLELSLGLTDPVKGANSALFPNVLDCVNPCSVEFLITGSVFPFSFFSFLLLQRTPWLETSKTWWLRAWVEAQHFRSNSLEG